MAQALQWTPSADGGLFCDFPGDDIVKAVFVGEAEDGTAIWQLWRDGTMAGIGALQGCMAIAERSATAYRREENRRRIKAEVDRLQAKSHMTIAEQKRVCALIRKLVPEKV